MLTMEQILDMAYTTALSQWDKEREHLANHPGELAKAWERKAWEKVEEIGRLLNDERMKKTT